MINLDNVTSFCSETGEIVINNGDYFTIEFVGENLTNGYGIVDFFLGNSEAGVKMRFGMPESSFDNDEYICVSFSYDWFRYFLEDYGCEVNYISYTDDGESYEVLLQMTRVYE